FFIGLVLLFVQLDFAAGARIFLSSVSFFTDSFSSLMPYLTIGRGGDDFLSLDGRVPLWQSLWPYFCERPFIGHGFGAFWNPARFDQIFVGVGWSATVAHNGFLDELLATGILGLILILAFWLQGMRESLRATHQEKHARYLVFGWLLLFLFFNSMGSILQSYFQSPT